jgi:hypothetical protein
VSALWLQIDADIAESVTVWEMAGELSPAWPDSGRNSAGASAGVSGVSTEDMVDRTLACLLRLWGTVLERRPDGNIGGVPDRLLETWAGWRGTPGAFAPVFRSHLTTDGQINGWADRYGRLVREREYERNRWHRRRSGTTPPEAPLELQRSTAGASAGTPAAKSKSKSKTTEEAFPALRAVEGNPLLGALDKAPDLVPPPAPPASPPSTPPEPATWTADAAALYKERIGLVPVGRIGKALKPLVTEYGWPRVRKWWDAYTDLRPYQKPNGQFPQSPADVGDKDVRFCSPEDFVKTYVKWQKLTETSAAS